MNNNITIDLDKLKVYNLNINEYLTLYKIYALSNMEEIPYYTNNDFISSLEKKEFIKIEENIIITEKGKRLLNINSLEEDITEIINYFKETTGKNRILETSPSNRKYIRDRLKQNYNKEDLKKVVDLKNNEWKDSKSMSKYIRIETLFNETKFQKYLNELDTEEGLNDSDNFKSI